MHCLAESPLEQGRRTNSRGLSDWAKYKKINTKRSPLKIYVHIYIASLL